VPVNGDLKTEDDQGGFMRIRRGIKTQFEMSYPVMSVYEFQFLKEEKEVIEWWKDSSIYIICQAPVLYFDELLYVDGVI
jgi:hypothetical protein